MVPKQHPLRELALFAGAGGGILGGKLLGWRTVCAVEIEPYCREVLMRRQNEGHLEPFPVWDDVRTFDGRPWAGLVDVISGGFPCQDISVAGKGAGIEGERSGLWKEFARIIGEVRPRFAFVENSPALVRRGLGTVLGDLAALGYDCRWGVFSGRPIGAPVERSRVFLAACSNQSNGEVWMGDFKDWEIALRGRSPNQRHDVWKKARPSDFRVGARLAYYVDRASAIGNGQIPAVAAAAWRILSGEAQ